MDAPMMNAAAGACPELPNPRRDPRNANDSGGNMSAADRNGLERALAERGIALDDPPVLGHMDSYQGPSGHYQGEVNTAAFGAAPAPPGGYDMQHGGSFNESNLSLTRKSGSPIREFEPGQMWQGSSQRSQQIPHDGF